MTVAEYEAYIASIDEVENRIMDDDKFPVVKDNKLKRCCSTGLEFVKVMLNFLKFNIKTKCQEQKRRN